MAAHEPTCDKAAIMTHVVESVARILQIDVADVMSDGRQRRYTWARQLAMMLCHEAARIPITDVAGHFARDRATVYHAIEVSEQRIHGDPPNQGLVMAWRAVRRELRGMVSDYRPTAEEWQLALVTFDTMYATRHREMTQAVQAHTIASESADVESRMLTAIKRHVEAHVNNKTFLLSERYRFPRRQLLDCLDVAILRHKDITPTETVVKPGMEGVVADLELIKRHMESLDALGEPAVEEEVDERQSTLF